MTDPKPLRRCSIIESMAAHFYDSWFRSGKALMAWEELPAEDRMRFVAAMEAAVASVPDGCTLKFGAGAASVKLTAGREAILADHRAAIRSILHGR